MPGHARKPHFQIGVSPRQVDAEFDAKSLVRVVDAAPRQLPAPEAIARALDVLEKAERPLIILGKGAAYSQADADIRASSSGPGSRSCRCPWPRAFCPNDHPQSAAAARPSRWRRSMW